MKSVFTTPPDGSWRFPKPRTFWLPGDRHRRVAILASVLALAFLGLAATAQPEDESDHDDAVKSRLFVVRAEQSGVPLRVTSLRGGDVYEGTTDDAGMLSFRLRVASDDEIRFAADSDRWQLDWAQKVRNAHLDPDIPLELDVGAFLQRSERTRPMPEAPLVSPEPAEAACGGVDDIQCWRRVQHRLADARRRGDCRSALALAQQLTTGLPDYAASEPGAVDLATLHFECALSEAAEGDLHARKEMLLRRTIALASGEDGAGWCHPQRSRILAAAYGELRETASAAAAARRARSLCPVIAAPVEWEFYLRLGLAQVGLAAEVADDAASRPEFADLGRFLRDWAAYAGGTCPVALSWDDDTPCTVLPAGVCARARTGWILRCADDSRLATYAEHLKGRLEAASESPQRPRILEDLADVEWARGEFAAVADAYGQLAEGPASPARRGLWLCRRGDALLRTQRPVEARVAFEQASALWRGLELSVSRLDRLVVDNNVLVLDLVVLGSGAGVVVDPARLEAVSEQLRDLEGETALRPWRLAVENNLLELRTRAEAAQADAGPATAREALERLRDIEADYRRHIQSVDEIGGDGEVPRACSILAFAGDVETNVEDEALGEQE